MKVLVVKSAFAGHERGSRITDPQVIEQVLASEHAQHVNLAEHEDEPLAAPAAPAKPKKSSN